MDSCLKADPDGVPTGSEAAYTCYDSIQARDHLAPGIIRYPHLLGITYDDGPTTAIFSLCKADSIE